MPLGLVRSGDFSRGTPILLPHVFGNLVVLNGPFGNAQPQSNDTLDSNPIGSGEGTAAFGNQVAFSLQTVPPVVIIAPSGTGTTGINLTNLLGNNSALLTYFGAPTGVTLSFAPNPDNFPTNSIATIIVGADVPVGRYTITVVGTVTATNIEYVQIQLIVATGGPVNTNFLVQEDGVGLFQFENGTGFILLEQ